MDLSDPDDRAAATRLLGEVFAGRRVVHGPRVLGPALTEATMLAAHGATASLVLATTRGASVPGDEPDHPARVVWLPHRSFATVSEELRHEDDRVRRLPDDAVAEIEDFDPAGEALWMGTPFVSSDEPILGRRVVGGRPARWLALEDKIACEEVWTRAGVPHAPSRVVPLEPTALARAGAELDQGAGVVWAGDNRDGFHGGGNLTRWVTDADERADALRLLRGSCDRVRVLPFLDGVPCSIHGFVLDDGVAAFRPVEIAMLRSGRAHGFVYGGLSTFWDPRPEDREQMRSVARRVGEHLRDSVGYRGFFGIDGVLTADGFRPTELNPRQSAGVVTQFSALEPSGLVLLLQVRATAYAGFPLSTAEVESVLPALDAHRTGRVTGMWEGDLDPGVLDGEESYGVRHDGRRLVLDDGGDALAVAPSATGLFAFIGRCTTLVPGQRLAALNVALLAFLDERYGTGFGEVTPAPDLRR